MPAASPYLIVDTEDLNSLAVLADVLGFDLLLLFVVIVVDIVVLLLLLSLLLSMLLLSSLSLSLLLLLFSIIFLWVSVNSMRPSDDLPAFLPACLVFCHLSDLPHPVSQV